MISSHFFYALGPVNEIRNDVIIICDVVHFDPDPAGRETNGKVSRGSSESLNDARKEMFTRVIFNKMAMGERTKE